MKNDSFLQDSEIVLDARLPITSPRPAPKMLSIEGISIPGMTPLPPSRLTPLTDSEILRKLQTHQPITKSEKNVWGFWDKGISHMPSWKQRNVVNWVRRLGPSWTVRILDLDPQSENYLFRYLPASSAEPGREFPAAFLEGKMTGEGKGQHAADLVRLVALYHFGGVYMDVGTILFRHLDDICWSAISSPNSKYEIAGFALKFRRYFGQMMNNFIACRKGNAFIKRWHQVYLQMWQDRTDVTDMHLHPLVQHLGLLKPDDPTFGPNPNYEAFTDYTSQILAYERLRLLREPSSEDSDSGAEDEPFNGPAYFKEHFFLLDAWSEIYLDQDIYTGSEIFSFLALPRNTSPSAPNREQQLLAETFVHNLCAHSCLAKFSQGFWQEEMPLAVAAFWEQEGNEDADCRVGTWGEYLRFVSTRFEQMRSHGRCLPPLIMPVEKDDVLECGYLESLSE